MQTLEMVNVGVIGAGKMANFVHYPALSHLKTVRLAAISDLLDERLTETANKYNVPGRYVNYKEMLDKERLDIVLVIMPPHHLYDIVVECLGRGLHVFIEKPPGITVYQTQNLARLAKENRCLTATGFNRRHIAVVNEVKRQVQENGPLTQVVSTFYKKGNAMDYYKGAVDAFTTDVIHAVDTLRWLAGGEVVNVASNIGCFDDVAPNTWQALVSFDNKVSGALLANWTSGTRVHNFEVHAPGCSGFIQPDGTSTVIKGGKRQVIDAIELAGSAEPFIRDGFFNQIDYFVRCVINQVEPHCNFADSVKTMDLVNRILNSQI
jgi:virulence factor